jgi:ABC-2 type transport system permease protein
MIDTIVSEWVKLRTVRVHAVLALIAVAFPLLIVVLVAVLSGDPADIGGDGLVNLIVGTSIVSAMLFGTISAISLTGDFGNGTIRPTFAATPNHLRVFLAKLAVNTGASGVAAVALVTLCWLVGALVLSQRDASVSLSVEDGSLGSLIALVVLVMLISWLAFGLGLVMRNSPATVSLLLLWPLLAEGLVGGVFIVAGADGLARWLPFQSVFAAVIADTGDDTLGRPLAFVWFGFVALVIVGIGVALDRRRDA